MSPATALLHGWLWAKEEQKQKRRKNIEWLHVLSCTKTLSDFTIFLLFKDKKVQGGATYVDPEIFQPLELAQILLQFGVDLQGLGFRVL